MKSNASKFFAYIISFFICICIIKGYVIAPVIADIIEVFNKEAIKNFITAYIKSEGFVSKYGCNYFYTNHINTQEFIINFVNANDWSTLLNTEMTPEQMAVIVSVLFDAHVDKAIALFEWEWVERFVACFVAYIYYIGYEALFRQQGIGRIM